MAIKSNDPDDLPLKPGVYLLKDSADRILYVGKAKSLKKRVKSYFRSDLDPENQCSNETIPSYGIYCHRHRERGTHTRI